jgi:hypothetical protein
MLQVMSGGSVGVVGARVAAWTESVCIALAR